MDYPECNGLIPLWHYAEGSKVPAAKSIPVRIIKDAVPEIIVGGEIPISATWRERETFPLLRG